MAKKKATGGTTPRKRRKRRTPEEIIADLQAEIRRVRERQVTKELKQSEAFRASLAAVKALDRALDAAAEEGETSLRHALADGRKTLGSYLEKHGLTLPKANLPKGRRPRDVS